MARPPVLCKPQVGVPLRLYFAVTEWAINSILFQEQDQVQKPIYFVSKALQGPELRYQSLEKAALAVVFSARRLRHYFHSFTVVVMTNLHIQKVLQKPDVAGRMVRWAVELSEFDIQYEPRGSIKGQVYADFVAERGVQVCTLEEGDTWMTPYRRYLANGILPAKPEEGKKRIAYDTPSIASSARGTLIGTRRRQRN